jgi:ATP-dependent exoDNAse (exonuclease V) beta subunit
MNNDQHLHRRLNPISLVRASAGTGKTFCLTEEFAKLLSPQPDGLLFVEGVDALQIIATTFTNRAADELMQRIQSHLIASEQYESAHLVRGSYIGTVNSICGRLVSEYALTGGLSPSITVLDEIQQRKLFLSSCEGAFGAFIDRLNDLAYRLSVDDWRNDVLSLVALARQNDIAKTDLRIVSEHSWNRLNELLPESLPSGFAEVLDAELLDAMRIAVSSLERSSDETKLTQNALEFLGGALATLEGQGLIPWSYWTRISKLKVAKKTEAELIGLKKIASKYLTHPQLRSDWRDMIDNVVSCACLCLDEYSSFKLTHGLIDFVDQELLAKSLLTSGAISDELADRCKILMVDEFQDTNPIQLAVFLKLAQSVQGSLWVGDEKQSIYAFRGAAPELTQQVCSRLIPETNGTEHQLSTSYRSRPELVSFSNSLFGECMPPLGIAPHTVSISHVARQSTVEMEEPLHFWWLNGKTFDESLISLSAGVLAVLKEPNRFMVQDKQSNLFRPILGSDIAILCRSNEHRLQVAARLVASGLLIATEREGLLDTAECSLAVAALRFMVDPYDTLAAGIIVRFAASNDAWLSDWLRSGFAEFASTVPILQTITEKRTRLMHLTPLETLELAIVGTGIIELIKRLGDFRQRSLNLDALRGLARRYEDDCLATGRAATAAGLMAYLQIRSIDNMQPPNPGEQAVNVLTYHKAKGLEWPLVVLFDLDNVNTSTAFGITVEQEGEIDILEPLRGRRLRYWPWPYGKQRRDVDLGQKAPYSKEFTIAAKKQHAESVRLMYVGVTRARDYLVFAGRPTIDGTSWLKELTDANGQPVLSLPFESGRVEILRDETHVHFVEMKILEPIDGQMGSVSQKRTSIFTTPSPAQTTPKISYRVTPSHLQKSPADDLSSFRISHKISFGQRIPMTGTDDLQIVGDLVHSFLAADDVEKTMTERMQLGHDLLSSWKIASLKAFDLITMSNRLTRAIATNFPGATAFRECPVTGFKGLQRMRGSVDLLLRTSEGYIVIDHKTYPGRMDTWETKCLSYAPQLYVYKQMVEDSGAGVVIGCYIHLPLLGQLLKIDVNQTAVSENLLM